MKLILKSAKSKRLIGLEVYHDGFIPANFLKWGSAVAYGRLRLISTLLSNEKTDLRLPRITFSNSDGNLSLMSLYRGQIPIRNVPHFQLHYKSKIGIV